MEKTIWKYELSIQQTQSILIPGCSRILTAQMQNGVPVLWAIVEPNTGNQTVIIEMFTTGGEIIDGLGSERNYISTLQFNNGFVAHVFEYIGI